MVKTSCALIMARIALSQILDDLESTFSFPLSAKRSFFVRGVISSTKVVREKILIASGTEVAR